MKNILKEANEEYLSLLSSFKSVEIATINKNGTPEVSYSPAIVDKEKNFYIYVSELSKHTENFLNSKKASVMLIEDNAIADSVFARKRITFDCESSEIERSNNDWGNLFDRFEEKFGSLMKQLKKMTDFHLIKLSPLNGRLVYGFGKAFDIKGENLDEVTHLKGFGNKGHKMEKSTDEDEKLSDDDIKRIINHMNEDHEDSIIDYLRYYGKLENSTSASIVKMDSLSMEIEYSNEVDHNKITQIKFDHEISSAHDAHMTMVKMAKTAKLN